MILLRIALAVTLFFFLNSSTFAQSSNILTPHIPVSGEISSGISQSWSFQATDDQPLSFYVEATSDGLDTAFSISDSTGEILIDNDDYDYPNSTDSLLEGITLPRSGDYTLNVRGAGGTSGAYQLTMLEGFAQVSSNTNFNGELDWQSLNSEITMQLDAGRLSLDLSSAARTGIVVNPQLSAIQDYYASVMVRADGMEGWIVGMSARQQTIDEYYLLQVNNRGEWRFLLRQQGKDSIVQDWITSPAIIPAESDFKLGMLVNRSRFEFFYNNQLFGSVLDRNLQTAGQTGLAIGTVSSQVARTVALFDELVITVPRLIAGERVKPQRLIITTPAATARELQLRGVIPTGGDLALTVGESFVESQRSGVESLLLGRGSTFSVFALGAQFTPTATADGMTGCGLIFRSQDETHYTLAYVDRAGGYGVSQREGDIFRPGIFGEGLSGMNTAHDLLIVASSQQVIYYIDGVYRGSLDVSAVEGAVGNAVVNFEPINTSCQFKNTWVWSWDS